MNQMKLYGWLSALTFSMLAMGACDGEGEGIDGGSAEDGGGQDVPDCNLVQQLPCFEVVWVDGVARRMTFFDVDVQTNPPTQNFYVMAPQSDTPQGVLPFLHDHVVAQDGGEYWHGFLVVCSEQGVTSGACVFAPPAEGSPPLAATLYGQRLKTVEAIEIGTGAGLLALVDTEAVLQATVDR